MADELFTVYPTDSAVDALIRNSAGQFANNDTEAFEAANPAHYADYVVEVPETDILTIYRADLPAWITTADQYAAIYKNRTDPDTPSIDDPATGDIQTVPWDGAALVTTLTGRIPNSPLDCRVSGQVVDPFGNAVANAEVTVKPSNTPGVTTAGQRVTGLKTTRTDLNGNWYFDLLRGLSVTVTVAGETKVFTVPDASTAHYDDL